MQYCTNCENALFKLIVVMSVYGEYYFTLETTYMAHSLTTDLSTKSACKYLQILTM